MAQRPAMTLIVGYRYYLVCATATYLHQYVTAVNISESVNDLLGIIP